MKKFFYLATAALMFAGVSCSKSTADNETNENSSDLEEVTADTVNMVSSQVEDSIPAENVVEEVKQPVQNNPMIDQLLTTCDNFIYDIKREGYDDGEPYDPASLQFSDVRDFIRDMKLTIDKLDGLQSEMTDAQKARFAGIKSQANKIYQDIPF